MTDEATLFGAESVNDNTITAPDPDESLLNALDDDPLPGDSPSDAEPPQVETYTVKINGEEKSVTRDELIAHYQKGVAAQEKFEQAAAMRREIDQQREYFMQQQAQLGEAIAHFQKQAQALMAEGEPNWQWLIDNNPQEYLRQKERYAQRMAAIQQANHAQAYLQQQQQEQQAQHLQQYISQEAETLVSTLIPEWKDQSVRARDEKELVTFLKGQGYSDQDLVNLNYSRAANIKLAYDAMKYNQLMAKAKATKKQAPPETANPVPTVGGKAGAIKDPTQMTDAEFAKWRQSQKARR